MGFFGPYVFKSKNGQKFWLHGTEKRGVKLYFFSKERDGALNDIPEEYKVVVNKRTGMPFLKKKWKMPKQG